MAHTTRLPSRRSGSPGSSVDTDRPDGPSGSGPLRPYDIFASCVVALATIAYTASPGLAQAASYGQARSGGSYMHNFYVPPAPSSSPWAPAWAPDGRSIAFSMQGSIWSVDVSTGEATELTSGSTYDSAPTWSPDGRWLVYAADYDGSRIQLEILDTQTGAISQLTEDDHLYLDPTFSPDGTQLAYVSTQPSGYFNVFVRSIAQGAWKTEPVAITYDNSYGSNRLYFGPNDMHVTPSWFPGGDELLLVSNRDVPLGSGNVLRVPVRRHGIDHAETVLAEQTLYRTRPDVSIDGKRFVYSSTAGAADQFNNLYVQPTVGGEPYKLTFFEHDAFHPQWSPDGEWIAFVTNEDGLPQIELLETYGGERRRIAITDRAWARPTGTLRVNVTSAESGEALAARIYLTASDSKSYTPLDQYARIGHLGDHVFHIDGTFEVEVPVGNVELTVVHGFETQPETFNIDVAEGVVADTTIALEELWDLGSLGCYSGSSHVHMNYAGNLHNTLENLMFMSRAEDQDVLNQQIANKDNRVLDHQFFEPGGGAHSLSTPDHVLMVGQEYRPPFYGHVFMFGMRDHLISPFVTGYEGTAIESLYPSNTDMLRKAIRQGATVGYVHPFRGDADPLNTGLGGAKGFMVDAALGTTHALEWSLTGRAGFFPLYAVWNNGLRVTAIGGEDSITNLHRWRLIGGSRTYVCTQDGSLSADAWYAGLRAGRAYVTTGPLLQLEVDGRGPGEQVTLAEPGDVLLRAEVRSITPLEVVEVVRDGEVIHTERLTGDRTRLELDIDVPFNESGWVHIRAWGSPEERFPLDLTYAQAFSNPVWVGVGAEPIRSRASAEYAMEWIDKLRDLAEAWPGWRSEAEKTHVFGQFDEARAVYEGFAREDSSVEGR